MPKKEIALTAEETIKLKEVLQLAQNQLEAVGKVMPEGKAAMDKYPGTNPIGFYSEIDMGIAERIKKCDLAIRVKNPLAWEEYHHLKELLETNPAYQDMKKQMLDISKKNRVVDRALRLCQDDHVRMALEEQKESLLQQPVLMDYNNLLKGLETYSGVEFLYVKTKETTLTQDDILEEKYFLKKFYKEKFDLNIGEDLRFSPYENVMTFANPKVLEIEFDDLDEMMQCQRMTHDNNLGKSWETVEKQALEHASFEEYSKGIPAYMQASCDRVLDSALPKVQDRADFILIDGVSIREQIKKTEGIENPSEEEIKKFSSLYVAAALRNGHYVETFIRNLSEIGEKKETISYKPVPITTKGSDSFLLKREAENEMESITLGFFDKFLAKLGFSFYQNKVKQANAIEQIKQSREQFRSAHKEQMARPLGKREAEEKRQAYSAIHKCRDNFFKTRESNMEFAYLQKTLDEQFFKGEKKDVINKATGILVEGNREKMRTIACARMLQSGYSLAQVIDISKYADVREQIAKQVMEELETCDEKRFMEMHMETAQTLMDALEDYAKENKISFKNPDSLEGKGNILMDIATGAGNIVDNFLKNEHKAVMEKYYEKEVIENMKLRTAAVLTNAMIPKEKGALAKVYDKLSQGILPTEDEVSYMIKHEVNLAVFGKLEEVNQKVFEHPIELMEMVSIQEMVMGHPAVSNFYKNATLEELLEVTTGGHILEKLKVDFEVLPEKMIPGRPIVSKQFDVEIEPDIATPVNIVPTFDGSSDFYKMTTMDKLMEEEMDMGME